MTLHALVARWRSLCDRIHHSPYSDGENAAYRRCADELAAALAETGWRSMDSAPRDGTKILFLRDGRVCIGRFDPDRYCRKPTPYWEGDDIWHGMRWMKTTQPTAWMLLPPPPAEEPGR